jgi:hypothetical protein
LLLSNAKQHSCRAARPGETLPIIIHAEGVLVCFFYRQRTPDSQVRVWIADGIGKYQHLSVQKALFAWISHHGFNVTWWFHLPIPVTSIVNSPSLRAPGRTRIR